MKQHQIIGQLDPILKARIKSAKKQIEHFTEEVQDPNNPNLKMSWALLVFWIKRLDERCQKISVPSE